MAKNKKLTNPVTKNYAPSDYQSKSEESQGLAMTHEQATDAYTEGTIDGVIDDLNGKNTEITRKGYKGEK